MPYCTFKADKRKGLDVESQINIRSFQESFFPWIVSRNLIFPCHCVLQKVIFFDFIGWFGTKAVSFWFLNINKKNFSHMVRLYLPKKSDFFLYNQKIWNWQYFKGKTTLELMNKYFINTTKIWQKKFHTSNLPSRV